jgi:DNA-binding XRE family transcriptional regulator
MSKPKDATRNSVRELREAQLLSKAELARKAGVSPLTIDRIESGMDCRMDTKRKIILALGLKLSEKEKVFAMSASASAHASNPAATDARDEEEVVTSPSHGAARTDRRK